MADGAGELPTEGAGGVTEVSAEVVAGFDPVAATAVCRRVVVGETLPRICADPSMPDVETVLGWVAEVPEFGEAYDRARGMMADVLFDEARDVALAATPEDVWVGRLKFDVIRWMTATMRPRKYSPKVVAEAAIAERKAEDDPQRQGLTVIIKRPQDITPEEHENARLTEEGYFDRPRSQWGR